MPNPPGKKKLTTANYACSIISVLFIGASVVAMILLPDSIDALIRTVWLLCETEI